MVVPPFIICYYVDHDFRSPVTSPEVFLRNGGGDLVRGAFGVVSSIFIGKSPKQMEVSSFWLGKSFISIYFYGPFFMAMLVITRLYSVELSWITLKLNIFESLIDFFFLMYSIYGSFYLLNRWRLLVIGFTPVSSCPVWKKEGDAVLPQAIQLSLAPLKPTN